MAYHKNQIKLGWKPDFADRRDKIMSFKVVNLATLPPKVDLRENCSTVENQSTLGSCTSNAAAGALEYLEFKDGVALPTFENFSRLFIYYNTRDIQGTVANDSGGTLRDTMKALAAFGACDELLWGYDVPKFTIKPGESCYTDAANHKITEYHRLETFPDCLACLAEGFPFVFGFMLYDSFMSEAVARTGIASLPGPNDICQGGHAVCAVGYDMENKTVLVRNSWGEHWGQGGYFTMPFEYISNPVLAQDFWTIRRWTAEKVSKPCPLLTAITVFYHKIFGYNKL
jgi:C1A family cysteine protease